MFPSAFAVRSGPEVSGGCDIVGRAGWFHALSKCLSDLEPCEEASERIERTCCAANGLVRVLLNDTPDRTVRT